MLAKFDDFLVMHSKIDIDAHDNCKIICIAYMEATRARAGTTHSNYPMCLPDTDEESLIQKIAK
jgi:hypothetical protein